MSISGAAWETWVPDQNDERPRPMGWSLYQAAVLGAWSELLASDPEELAVQAFLELHPAMIPGGSGDVGPGGHHHSDFGAVFTQPVLKGHGRDFSPDFMWVTRSTSLITPILIEIEKPSKRWFRKDGRPTAEFTHARDQMNDWRAWFAIDANRSLFRDTYLIGGDRYEHRSIEPQFLLIYGRQAEFAPGGGHLDPGALIRKRDLQRARDEYFMTFDSLRPRHDHGNSVTVRMTVTGPEAVAFSPTYETHTMSGGFVSRVRGIPGAIAASAMVTTERRTYLIERLTYWGRREKESRRSARTRAYQMGLE